MQRQGPLSRGLLRAVRRTEGLQRLDVHSGHVCRYVLLQGIGDGATGDERLHQWVRGTQQRHLPRSDPTGKSAATAASATPTAASPISATASLYNGRRLLAQRRVRERHVPLRSRLDNTAIRWTVVWLPGLPAIAHLQMWTSLCVPRW